MKIKNILFAATATTLMSLVAPALATQIYTLNASAAGTFPGISTFGTVTLDDIGTTVNVTVSLANGGVFANTGNSTSGRTAFALMLGSGFSIALSGSSAESGIYQAVQPGGSLAQNPFGTFNAGITFKDTAANGASGGYNSPITFAVTKTGGGAIGYSDFTTLSSGTGSQQGTLFSADVGFKLGTSTAYSTGNVATAVSRSTPDGDPRPVPEPTTLALLGLGLLGCAIARHRKN